MVRRPGIALVVSGVCCAASDAEVERARRGTDDETDDETARWGAVEAAAATTALRAAASMVAVCKVLRFAIAVSLSAFLCCERVESVE